ncbi:26S protease regulatory subunit 7 [Capsicum baccatum]|uniref:26S protease regulatory subunit 7 n=1 Tax=Capsicum baccatum TaxID=33114 RepID=A0A2G2WYC0_CAPBA|nr:26S protease regulatory subunit 7 [Capsicum baccatum]
MDPSYGHFTIEEKTDVTYNDVGGYKEQIEKMREGILCYGPLGTGKTFLTRAVVNCIDAYFIRVIGSELVQKYMREKARIVRELFQVQRNELQIRSSIPVFRVCSESFSFEDDMIIATYTIRFLDGVSWRHVPSTPYSV